MDVEHPGFVFVSQRNGLWKDAIDAKADLRKAEQKERTHSLVSTPAHTPVRSKVTVNSDVHDLLLLCFH